MLEDERRRGTLLIERWTTRTRRQPFTYRGRRCQPEATLEATQGQIDD